MNRTPRKIFTASLIVSLLLHGLFLLFTYVMPSLHKPVSDVVEFEMLTEEELARLQEKNGQFVDQAEKAINDETPEKSKFLSQHNQTVQKQTRAQNFGQFQNANKGPQTGTDTGSKGNTLNKFLPQMDYKKAVEKQQAQEAQLEKTLDEEAMKFAEKKKDQPTPESSGGSNGNQASQTSDYLKEIDAGAETLLSTREFVYHSFYSRIRSQLNQHWSGKVREKLTKMFKAGRTIASTDDKVTKLLITLNNQGQLVKVQVLSDSGVRDLDEAAIEAFNEAAPFPNPPKGIVESDGTIKIRWDFVLEV